MSENKPLLIRFKEGNSMMGANRDTLKQCAERLGVSETAAVHIAINRLYMELYPERIAEAMPTDEQIAEANARNAPSAKDPVVHSASLADMLGIHKGHSASEDSLN